jgi:predicted RNA-binding protein YlqC (UPF0109 family)
MNSSIDQQFVEFVVKSLVSKPDAVQVERRIDEKGVLLELTVDPEDLGRVIGKRGATAQSLRTLLRALGTKNDARYNLKIVDNGVGGPHGSNASASTTSDEPADYHHQDQAAQPAASTAVQADHSSASAPQAVAADDTSSVSNDRLQRTRQELQELDDLDV